MDPIACPSVTHMFVISRRVGNSARERVTQAGRWVATRSPTTFLIAGWVVFFLGSYPGYLSFESTMQLFDVRNGVYTDAHPAVMTGLWSLLEFVATGPFPMLALQSGLFLFGLAAILRTALSPRAAAITAAAVLLFPPVFSPMAVIWPDSLMAGALLAGAGALLEPRWSWRIAGGALLAIACACRPEAALAIIPIVVLAVPRGSWPRRASIALAISIGLASVARLADWALTDTETYTWKQSLMVTDLVGTLRRARLTDEVAVTAALDGLPIADRSTIRDQLGGGHDVIDWWPLTHGDQRMFDLITTDEQSGALSAAWRRAISEHPRTYFAHRWLMTRNLLGVAGRWDPVFDSFGDFELLAPLHHRATSSDWQYGMQQVVRAFARTPLFRPWLYLLLAVVAVILARRERVLRAVIASGLIYEVTLMVLAPSPDFRFSHWLICSTCTVLAAMIAVRRWKRVEPDMADGTS